MGFEPGLFGGRPCDLPGCASSAYPSVSFARCFSRLSIERGGGEEWSVRAIGLDVHLDFCEVAIVEDGEVRSAGRIETTPERLELFAGSLGPEDRVALGGDGERVGDRADPRAARRAGAGRESVGYGDPPGQGEDRPAGCADAGEAVGGRVSSTRCGCRMSATRVMRRRLSRREQLVRARSRAKNEIHAVLMRRLVGRPPVQDLFGVKGRRGWPSWSCRVEERETVDGGLRQIEFLDPEIAAGRAADRLGGALARRRSSG